MDHQDAVRLKATERYLLNELDPDQLDQFEEHLFDCRDCALDVRAAAMFLEQSKNVLVESPQRVPPQPVKQDPSWLSWLRPAFAVPVLALLVVLVGYQNLVSIPRLRASVGDPKLLPWAPINIGTYGSEAPAVVTSPGKGFILFVRIPPDPDYSAYTADLYNASGSLEWSLPIPAKSSQDQWPVAVPGTNRKAGTYTLAVHGITAAGQTKEIGRTSFELQIQK